MTIVCINNVELGRDSNGKPRHTTLPLTIGKTYKTTLEGQLTANNIKFYMIRDNSDELRPYPDQYFVTVSVWRQMQLNRLI